MRKVVLGSLAAKGNQVARALLENRMQPIYTTRVEVQGMLYELATTSKKLHLKFGQMDYGLQVQFCDFLTQELKNSGGAVVLFEKDADRSGIFVTTTFRTAENHVMHLAPIS